MSSIPEEIYLEILLRIPVKSTFVCKCVCKTWLSLISDPSFAKMHLDFTPRRNISSKLVVSDCYDRMGYYTCIDSSEPSLLKKNKFTSMRHPFYLDCLGIKIIGSCNGLLCLMYYSGSEEVDTFFCLWNPATREYKEISRLTDDVYFDDIMMHAVGYDHKNHDYKLVIGVKAHDNHTSTSVYVYALQSNSWKSAITVPYYFPLYQLRYHPKKSGVLVNGDFHFLVDRVQDSQDSLIVSLDISKERFKEIELSAELKRNGGFKTEAVLEGRLCVLNAFGADSGESNCRVELWVMQQYGVRESWTKRYVITHKKITRNPTSDLFPLNVVLSFKNGEILLNMKGLLISYDPRDGSAIQRYMSLIDTFEVNYIESLVSVNTGTYETGEVKEFYESSEEYYESEETEPSEPEEEEREPSEPEEA